MFYNVVHYRVRLICPHKLDQQYTFCPERPLQILEWNSPICFDAAGPLSQAITCFPDNGPAVPKHVGEDRYLTCTCVFLQQCILLFSTAWVIDEPYIFTSYWSSRKQCVRCFPSRTSLKMSHKQSNLWEICVDLNCVRACASRCVNLLNDFW